MKRTATGRVEDLTPIRERDDVERIALGQYELLLRQLEDLDEDDWGKVTVCEPWTVHQMVAHLLGAAHSTASLREAAREVVYGLRHKGEYDGSELDAMNDLQVRDHQHKSPQQMIDELRTLAPRSASRRARLPRFLAAVPLPNSTEGNAPSGVPDRATLGELQYAIYSRDVFMHRIDIADATGRELEIDAEVDGRLVEDVVLTWYERHGRPFELVLGGPAGGRFVAGRGGERIEMDAIEFCRVLAGRAPAEGLLAQRVLF